MAFLKLDARHPECHGLARALVGSPAGETIHANFCYDLVGLTANYGFILSNEFVELYSCGSILLPLATLKLCPYVAMKEGLNVKMVAYIPCEGYSIDRGVRLSTGLIAELGVNIDEAQFTLDLENLPKGAEVVEL